jgi:hypothetical protein
MTPSATDTHSESTLSTVNGTLGALTGLGILTMALAPLAIPFLVLTVVFLAPLALPGLLLVPLALVFLTVKAGRRLLARSNGSAPSRQEPRRVHASSQAG